MTNEQDACERHQSQKRSHFSLMTRSSRERRSWATQQASARQRRLKGFTIGKGIGITSSRRPRWPSIRQINLNKITIPAKTSEVSENASPVSRSESEVSRATSLVKRKQSSEDSLEAELVHSNGDTVDEHETPVTKKQKHATQEPEKPGHTVEAQNDSKNARPSSKAYQEKQRQKKKKKRQKADKQAWNAEHQQMMEDHARKAETESTQPRRFLVAMPLSNVSRLSGGSVSRHFRKRDLTLNDITPVSLETLFLSLPAKLLYESLRAPIYFAVSCRQSVARLKRRLRDATVCSRLLVLSEEQFREVRVQRNSSRVKHPRLLGEQTLTAIERVLEDAQPPHELESSQNAEDKIKSLFKPILRSLDIHNTIITTCFNWREKIGLRSSTDIGTHEYSPKSDAAIIEFISDNEAKILILFEAYSRLGQSLNTPDENRADRVRLLIQGSYISIRDEKPSVVYYLTRDKCMETIVVFAKDEERTKFGYYAEKQPFYNEVSWVDLVCQIVNVV